MPRYANTHREKTKQAIIDAAAKMLREKGFTETTVANVMREVGLTVGGFYAHFEDKNAMLAAAVQEAFVESPHNFDSLAKFANAKADLSRIAHHYLSPEKVENVATGCPAAALMSEIPRQEQAVKAAFQQGTLDTQTALAQAQGLETSSFAALSMLVGGLMMMRALPQEAMRETIRQEITQAMLKLKD